MKTAIFIQELEDWENAHLYKLDPPTFIIEYMGGIGVNRVVDHVVVSAINNGFGIETYIFPAETNGNVINMSEMNGSFRGECNHKKALDNAGYTVVP